MDNKKFGERVEEVVDSVNRLLDAAVEEIADRLEVDPNVLMMIVVIAVAVFAIGFTYGYHKSNEHFLELVNKHQLEHGMPAVDSRIFIVD